MIQNSQTNTYKKVFQKDNLLLEVGLVSETIKLRLTQSLDISKQKIYIGVIKSLEGHPELKRCFGELHQNKNCKDWLLDPKNIYLDLHDMSIRYIYVSKRKETLEMAKICLQLYVPNIENKSELLSVIQRCNSQYSLKDEEIKHFFKTLAEKHMTGKSESQNKINQLKKELKEMNEKNIKQNKFLYNTFKKEYDTINNKNEQNFNALEQFKKTIKIQNDKIKEKYSKMEKEQLNEIKSLQKRIDQLNNELSKLNEQFNSKMQVIKSKSQNQWQKLQIIKNQMDSINLQGQIFKQKIPKKQQQDHIEINFKDFSFIQLLLKILVKLQDQRNSKKQQSQQSSQTSPFQQKTDQKSQQKQQQQRITGQKQIGINIKQKDNDEINKS